jgi:hypothetical protein
MKQNDEFAAIERGFKASQVAEGDEAMRNLAGNMGSFYDELRKRGMPRRHAAAMTHDIQKLMWNSSATNDAAERLAGLLGRLGGQS